MRLSRWLLISVLAVYLLIIMFVVGRILRRLFKSIPSERLSWPARWLDRWLTELFFEYGGCKLLFVHKVGMPGRTELTSWAWK